MKKAKAKAWLARPKGRTSIYTLDKGPKPNNISIDNIIKVIPRLELA